MEDLSKNNKKKKDQSSEEEEEGTNLIKLPVDAQVVS
jgi:hypothetical protein